MKVSVNDKVLFELNDTQKAVMKNDIMEDIFDEDLCRRLQWILMHKYEQCFAALKSEWEPKLADRGIKMLPVDKDEFAQLVFKQDDYKNRSAREAQ